MSHIDESSAQNNLASRAEAVSSVKSQLEEAISTRLGSEPGKTAPAHLGNKDVIHPRLYHLSSIEPAPKVPMKCVG